MNHNQTRIVYQRDYNMLHNFHFGCFFSTMTTNTTYCINIVIIAAEKQPKKLYSTLYPYRKVILYAARYYYHLTGTDN